MPDSTCSGIRQVEDGSRSEKGLAGRVDREGRVEVE